MKAPKKATKKSTTKTLKTPSVNTDQSSMTSTTKPASTNTIEGLEAAVLRLTNILSRMLQQQTELRAAVGALDAKVEWYRSHPTGDYVVEKDITHDD